MREWFTKVFSPSKAVPRKRDDVVSLSYLQQPLLHEEERQWWDDEQDESLMLGSNGLVFTASPVYSDASESGALASDSSDAEGNVRFSNFLMHDSVIAQRLGHCEIIQDARCIESLHHGGSGFGRFDDDADGPECGHAPSTGDPDSANPIWFSAVPERGEPLGAERADE